ncbi:MAG: citrate/2-methylcitrate synthase [Clostridiaceae bacterium]|nr:citrate/2-methylcitrate synthase [Clostridiaceae bacterium]
MEMRKINSQSNELKPKGLSAELFELAKKNVCISPDNYEKYNVKRGLRNNDGTGVLVGLTVIGDVQSYVIKDGEKINIPGELFYRGINVREIVKGCISENRFGFEEVIYLLLFGELPTSTQLEQFSDYLSNFRKLPENFVEDMILKAPSPDIMNKLARSVLALYSYDDDPDNLSLENLLRQSFELIARFPEIIAYAYMTKRHYYDGKSLLLHTSKQKLSIAENFLRLVRPNKQYTEQEAKILDLCLILHAEHGGGNNSTFATHVISSTGTDTYSSIAASIGSLKGSKHGGANNRVMTMMDEIKSNVKDWDNEDEVSAYIAKIINKQACDKTGLVYGFGHAVYTLSDPRTELLKGHAQKLAEETGRESEYRLYDMIERITPKLFAEIKNQTKPLPANVDFYSGFIYSMLNIPQELYTPLFAMSRIVGWCAHRIEEVITSNRIIRPAYKNVSETRK